MPLLDYINRGISKPTKKQQEISTYFKPVDTKYSIKNRGVDITDQDINSFRPLLYGEVSNRTPDKQALEADVIFNTAINRVKAYGDRGQNKTLSEVLAMPNQYQAYGGKQYSVYNNPGDPVAEAKKRQVDAIVDEIYKRVKSGQYEDSTQGSYYYIHNPDGTITYDNSRPLFAK